MLYTPWCFYLPRTTPTIRELFNLTGTNSHAAGVPIGKPLSAPYTQWSWAFNVINIFQFKYQFQLVPHRHKLIKISWWETCVDGSSDDEKSLKKMGPIGKKGSIMAGIENTFKSFRSLLWEIKPWCKPVPIFEVSCSFYSLILDCGFMRRGRFIWKAKLYATREP